MSLNYTWDIAVVRPMTDATRDYFSELTFRGPGAPGGLAGIRTSELTPSYTWNTVNSAIQPGRGMAFNARVNIAGLGGSVRMIEPGIEVKYFWPGFRRGHVIAMHARGRILTGYGGRAAPPFERYYMGGESDVRGFDSWSLGPIGYIPGERLVNSVNLDGSLLSQRDPVTGALVNITFRVPNYRQLSVGGDTNAVANFEYRIPVAGL